MYREFIFNATRMKDRRRDLRSKQTKTESLLWYELRNKKLGYKFRRQYSICNYVIDFYCVEKKLGIELEGRVHNTTSVKKYDEYRFRYLESFGVKLYKFPNGEIENNLSDVLTKIKQLLL